jgi:glucose-1-phosphate cytidylyltransferase
MKVVLFCGGLGLRMREGSDRVPKPMVALGDRPLVWHVMKYYAHYGHTDFILCLGHRAEVIKDYFLNYDEALSNDFVLSGSNREVTLLASDIHSWTITFVNTGMKARVGERLMAVQEHLGDDEYFLANYSDGVTDAPLDLMIENLVASGRIASLLSVRPTYSFHTLSVDEHHLVRGVHGIEDSNLWMNGGFFVLRRDIFDYMRPGEDLVNEPFRRLIAEEQLLAWRHTGFYYPVDTMKDKQILEDLMEQGNGPWRVWEGTQPAARILRPGTLG